MEMIKTLKNGVKLYDNGLENDFSLAQEIFDLASQTENIDTEFAYNDREFFDGLGTYEIMVERNGDYERFMSKVREEQAHFLKEIEKKKDDLFDMYYYKGLMTREECVKFTNKLSRELDNGCNCKKCNFEISFNEWKSGKMKSGAKVGKSLGKAGFSKELLDFYSLQVKTERKAYLTISDHVQNIAGMSNFFKPNSTNFYGGTSCQDTRHDGYECISLGGALHDNKLFVAMLHKNMDDVYDMQNKMLARVIMRLVHIDGVPCLVPSKYYGNNETMSALHYCLQQLSEMEVYSRDVRGGTYDSLEKIREEANGYFYMNTYDEIYICETYEDEVEVECPMCYGNGRIERELNNGNDVEIGCPACSGNGEIYASYYIDIDEWIEVEDEMELAPYTDDYSHLGYYITIDVNLELIRKMRDRNNSLPISRLEETL